MSINNYLSLPVVPYCQPSQEKEISSSPLCMIIPPHMEKGMMEHEPEKLKKEESSKVRNFATLYRKKNIKFRKKRCENCHASLIAEKPESKILIYNSSNTERIPGIYYGDSIEILNKKKYRGSKDLAGIEAYKGALETNAFFTKVFNRKSIDNKNMDSVASVHFGNNYNNAFWNSTQMVYGDGDGIIFERFTKSIDVIVHELVHGITQYSSGLKYEEQPGALNEAMSDIFATMVKQYLLKQSVGDINADWLIGKELFTAKIGKGKAALRSLKDPGNAYDIPELGGKDPQVGNMHDYLMLEKNERPSEENDYGWVHLNSGIINKANYEANIHYGDYSWGAVGRIWYESLLASQSDASFKDFATTTVVKAVSLYGKGSKEESAIRHGWGHVQVDIDETRLRTENKEI